MRGEVARPLISASFEALEKGLSPIIIAPTGYGKTRSIPWIHEVIAVRGELARGVILVEPLRALVEEVYEKLFKPIGGGVQAHGVGGYLDKSPYFLRLPVVTTIDSFILDLYRLPVLEATKIERGVSRGHYYPALAAIKTSLVVFDEAHLVLAEDTSHSVGVEALKAGLRALAESGVPLMLETASMRPSIVAEAASKLAEAGATPRITLLSCSSSCRDSYADSLSRELASRGLGGELIQRIIDKEFCLLHSLRWETRLIGSWSAELLKTIADSSSRGPVLVVTNTVDNAIYLYRKLEELAQEVVLIHGRLAEKDRARAISMVKDLAERAAPAVIVSTQVVEAGVDVNVLEVYSDAAPLENLIQRTGRACRRGRVLEDCKRDGAKTTIIVNPPSSPYRTELIVEAVSLIREALGGEPRGFIDWRLPCRASSASYVDLLARSMAQPRDPGITGVLESVYRDYILGDAPPTILLEILRDMGKCAIYRGLAPAPLYVEGYGSITVSLEVLTKPDNWIWEVIEKHNGLPILLVADENSNIVGEAKAKRTGGLLGRGTSIGCRELLYNMYLDLDDAVRGIGPGKYHVFFKIDPRYYEPGVGLLREAVRR